MMCERNIYRLPLARPHPGTWPASQACVLTGNRTGKPSVHRPALSPLSHISQGMYAFSFCSKRLDYVNHARRLAEDDWTGVESEEEEDKKDDQEMDVDPAEKLPKRYANQVSVPRVSGPALPTPFAVQSGPTE